MDAPDESRKKLPLTKCKPESFHRYLLSTVNNTESKGLGTILGKGLYAKQLATYLEYFPKGARIARHTPARGGAHMRARTHAQIHTHTHARIYIA